MFLTNIIKVVSNKSNTMQAAWIGLGSLISMLLGIISSAILSRYLIKSDYGTYKQVMYIYNTLLIVFSLGLPRAYSYFLARSSVEEGYSIVKKINRIFLLIGIIFSLCLYLGSSIFADLLNNPSLKDCLELFAITPIFLLPMMGIESIMATYRKSHINAIYLFSTRFFSLICVVVPVLIFKATVYFAILGFVISAMLTCFLGYYLEKRPFKNYIATATSLDYKEIMRFSLPLFWASIWGLVINSANQFFISRYWGTEIFAEFSNGFFELPFVGMIVSAGAAVLLPVFSKMMYEKRSIDEFVEIWKSVFIKSAKIIYPLAVFFCVFATDVMLILYGEQYIGSSIYFRIILVVNLCKIIQYAPIIIALGQVKAYAGIHMSTAILIVALEYASVQLCPSPYMIAIIYVFCILFCIGGQLIIISKSLNLSIISLIPYKTLAIILLLSGIVSFIVKSVTLFLLPHSSSLIVLVVAFLLFVFLYLIASKIFRLSYMDVIYSVIKK